MKRIVLFTGLLLVFLLAGFSSCGIDADLSHCDRRTTLLIRALGYNGEDITDAGGYGDVLLFAYDTQGAFLYKTLVPADSIRAHVPLNLHTVPGRAERFIAWSNIADTIRMMDFAPERTPAQNSFKALTDATGYASLPKDMFHGEKTLPDPQALNVDGTVILEIRRALAQMHVSVVGMEPNINPAEYFIVMDNDDQAGLDFENRVLRKQPASMKYRRQASWLVTDKMMGTAEAFLTFPSPPGTSKTAKLYHGTELIASATTDIEGKPIAPLAGRRMNILIDLNGLIGTLEMRIVVSDWDQVVLWENW